MAQRIVGVLFLGVHVLGAIPLVAQSDPGGFDAALQRWAAQPPKGFSLTLERLNGPVVTEGELLRIRAEHRTPNVHRYRMPRQPFFYHFTGFLVSPPLGGCGTIAQPCVWKPDRVNDFSSLYELERWLRPVETDINSYLPHLPPGSYRVAVVLQKELLLSSNDAEPSFAYADPPEYLISNSIEFEIRPASEDWVRETLASERAILLEILDQFEGDHVRAEQAGRQIGNINRPEAHLVALDVLGRSLSPDASRDVTHSLARDVPARDACALLRSGLSRPEQNLNTQYAIFMGERCAEAEAPFPDEPRTVERSPQNRVAQAAATQEVMAAIAERAQQAEQDSPELRAMRMQVLDYGVMLLTGSTSPFNPFQASSGGLQVEVADLPPFVLQTAARVIRDLPIYLTWQISNALQYHWPLVREVNPEAVLRRLIGSHLDPAEAMAGQGYDAPTWSDVRRHAIVRFVELQPSQRRAILLDELTRFRPSFDETLANLLPREEVPPMDDAILRRIAAARRSRNWYNPAPQLLIERYLSPAAADRLKPLIEEPRGWCEPEVLAYFFRAQPATAEAILKRTPWDMHKPVDGCWESWISGVPPLEMHPVMENYLIAHLQHEAPNVKWMAARKLSEYGSAKARAPLEEAFRYFHEYWKGREAELENPGYRDGWMLESALRTAIAWGRAWFSDAAALQKLGEVCMTSRCRTGARSDLAQWEQKPLRLQINSQSPEGATHASIAHYRGIKGLEATLEKLAQFPAGTAFRLQLLALPPERDAIAAELQRVASEAGLILE